MSVTFAVESWSAVWPELAPHWVAHWTEVALDHAAVPLDVDHPMYLALEANGSLCVVVARKDGKVIGYHISIVRPHLHYRNSLHAFVDVYYVAIEHRQGMTGVRLIKESERALKQRGVVKVISGTKMQPSAITGKSLDMSAIFKRLGWRETERTFTKCI